MQYQIKLFSASIIIRMLFNNSSLTWPFPRSFLSHLVYNHLIFSKIGANLSKLVSAWIDLQNSVNCYVGEWQRVRVSDARHRTSILLWKIYRAMLCWDTLTFEMSKFVDIQQYFFKSVLFPIYPPMNITVISRSSCLLALWRLYLWWNSTHSQTRVRIYLHARTHEVMYAPLHACTCENTCTYVRSTLQTESLT